jgi:transcriptional regulator with XRE-family HTH domain
MAVASTGLRSRSANVLTRALVRASRNLGMSQRDLAAILGVSESSVSRLRRGRTIDPDTKEGEIAILFLRMYRSLDALVGGSDDDARNWLHAANHHLGEVPAELVRGVAGLVRVADYLDAMRGKS